jgi:hypothetical protein
LNALSSISACHAGSRAASYRKVGAMTNAGSYPDTLLRLRTLGFALAASAAFSFALAPVTLDADELPTLQGSLAGHSKIISDGGIVESLRLQRLLSSSRLGAHNILSRRWWVENAWVPSVIQRSRPSAHTRLLAERYRHDEWQAE